MAKRSPLFYVGDKSKLVDQLLPLFPKDIGLFVEPFAGGASTALNVTASKFHLNDQNEFVIRLHSWLSGYGGLGVDKLLGDLNSRICEVGLKSSFFGDIVPSALKSVFPKTYFAEINRIAYNTLRANFNASDKSEILDLYLLIIFGFNRMIRFNSKNAFNVPVGNVDMNHNVAEALANYIAWSKSNSVSHSAKDYQVCIDDLDITSSDFIYFDPPYLIAQAEYNKSWTELDEQRLHVYLDQLTSRGVRWALSNVMTYKGLRNQLLDSWSSRYNVHEINARYISYRNNTNKQTGEVLITNYDH
jgi:DNA adenine methylase